MELLVGFEVMVFLLVTVFLFMRLYRAYRQAHYEVPADDIRKGHRWFMEDIFPEQTYCNIGHSKIKHGAKCCSCGICVDDPHMKEADKKIPCKPVSLEGDTTHHHWVQGNLPLYSTCYICNDDCGVQPHICDVWCAWCRRTAHENCRPDEEVCDFGEFKTAVVPPSCVQLKWVGLKGRKHLVVDKARKPDILNWSPVIIVANRKSGNNEGEVILREFKGLLNSAQVIDLHDIPPESGLEWCHLLPDVTFRVVVCGGDGTVGWVLNVIEKLKLKTPPQVCILPLGTGNDLSRVLGWGEGHTTGDVHVEEIFRQMQGAKPVSLDRWKVEIKNLKRVVFPKLKYKKLMMNNYTSVGVDALVTLNFHRQRQYRPWLFAHRIINKLCYFTYGTKDVLERECKHLHKKIKVELDGKEISLPEIEGLVILNISSWGGGCQPWGLADDDKQFKPQRYDDGLLEVMALYSSFHIAQLRVGLAAPVRLGQAKTVKISLRRGKVPMQVDGEPWEQSYPADITVTYHSKASILART